MNARRLAVALAAALALHVPGATPRPSFTLLSANVGNLDALTGGPCAEWPARGALCVPADEVTASDALRARAPDVIALFEVLPGDHDASAGRLLGPDYAVVCDRIGGYDCLGLRRDRFAVHATATPDQPSVCAGKADFAAVFTVDTTWNGAPLRFVVAHPYQAFDDEEDRCREAQLQQAFVELPQGDTVIVGDLNVDPDRMHWFFASPQVWHANVGSGRPFRSLHHGVLLPDPTWLGALTLDHVVVRGLAGGCSTIAPLAERMDHRALWCSILR